MIKKKGEVDLFLFFRWMLLLAAFISSVVFLGISYSLLLDDSNRMNLQTSTDYYTAVMEADSLYKSTLNSNENVQALTLKIDRSNFLLNLALYDRMSKFEMNEMINQIDNRNKYSGLGAGILAIFLLLLTILIERMTRREKRV
ncbi:MAG: hypothetical protein C0425_07510 [Chlorobiaceae bacterium]|nr:hypothetical protein [Chlorobiaceae bacterium]MBA4310169.1 hypothetical protein [Chlorobiaceae bacterium]